MAYFDPPHANTVGYGEERNVLDSVLFGGEVGTLNLYLAETFNPYSHCLIAI
jgi:hypothetical protein